MSAFRLRRRRVHIPPLIGFLVVIGAATILVARQPVTAPWWINADADATYSSSGLEILAGTHSDYFDHPGFPEQELLAVTFGAVSLVHGGPTRAWAADEMLHLNRARPVFRGWAIAFFIGGAAITFFLLSRLFRHWTWGVAGGLLWLAQPGLTDSIQIRPDVLLALLSLVVGFLLIRAGERRSPLTFAFAAAVIGFTIMVKLSAVALLASLFVATVVTHPNDGWPGRLWAELRAWLSQHRFGLTVGTALWLALAVALNAHGPKITTTTAGNRFLLEALLILGVYGTAGVLVQLRVHNRLARRLVDPFYVVLAVALAIGTFATVGLYLADGLAAFSSVLSTLGGGNLNAGIKPFSTPLSPELRVFPLRQAFVVFVLAGVGALWSLRRRDFFPAIWFVGAALAGVMAAARLAAVHYFALAYVLSIPAALWLFRRQKRTHVPLLAWLLVLYVLLPTFQDSREDAIEAARMEQAAAAATRLGDALLKPGEVAVVPDQFSLPDDRWYSLVQNFTTWHPTYPYRYLDDYPAALQTAEKQGLKLRYYIGSNALSITSPTTLTLSFGTYRVRPIPGMRDVADGIAAVELVSGPGT